MPLDAICLSAIKEELEKQITGVRIDKLQQPERDVIVLSLRGIGVQSQRLLISVGSGDTRMHFTEHKLENPKSPPMFCMLLRKHLTGAKIVGITQPPAERIISITFEASDVLGDKAVRKLTIEMMGNISNIILTDGNDLIIDCLRRTGDMSTARALLPGLIYRYPPVREGKKNPLTITEAEFPEMLKAKMKSTKGNNNEAIEKWLNNTLSAFSPLVCREIVWRAYADTDYRFNDLTDDGVALQKAFVDLISSINNAEFVPCLISDSSGNAVDFSFLPIKQYEDLYSIVTQSSFSALLDGFFTLRAKEKFINQKSAATLKIMTLARDRIIRKLAVQKAEIDNTVKCDFMRQCGDLIIANIHLIKKGQEVLQAEDYYCQGGGMREIKLDTQKTPQQNAAKYFKLYSKLKNAKAFLSEMITKGEKELEYVESVIEQISRLESESDLNEIRNELIVTGYIKQKRQQELKKTKQVVSSPYVFLSSSGMRILVGRNNIQNDKLTLKSSARTDMWLHAQKIHGAHVIISCEGTTPDEDTINEAATIAAYYSSARNSGKVPIDFTLVKNVKKPAGGKPGMVIYNDFKTIIAIPDEELVNKLRAES